LILKSSIIRFHQLIGKTSFLLTLWMITVLSFAIFCSYGSSSVQFPKHTYLTNPSKPWLNSKIFALIRQKKSLWQKFRRSLSIEDHESHRKLSNTLSKQIKLAKKGYEERLVNSGNPKSLFKFVRRVLATDAKEFRLKRADDTLTTSDYETANLFAHFFSHIYHH
jgi:hypothetical protein